MPKIKVTYYLSTGQKITVKCDKFELNEDENNSKKATIIGCSTGFYLELDKVIAITFKTVLF